MATIRGTGNEVVYEGTNNQTLTGSIILTPPSSVSGDLMLLVMHQAHRVSTADAPVAPGYTLEARASNQDITGRFYSSTLVYSKIAGASEGDVVVSGIYDGSEDALGYITVIQDHNGIGGIETLFTNETGLDSFDCTTITTTEDNSLILTFYSDRINGPRQVTGNVVLLNNNQRPIGAYVSEAQVSAGESTLVTVTTDGGNRFQKINRATNVTMSINNGGGTPPVVQDTGDFFNFL